jgi:hypothetical protein
MGKEWKWRVVSHEEFLAEQRRAHIPEKCIRWLDAMAPRVILPLLAEGIQCPSHLSGIAGRINYGEEVEV